LANGYFADGWNGMMAASRKLGNIKNIKGMDYAGHAAQSIIQGGRGYCLNPRFRPQRLQRISVAD
jgi:hypothetical protein